MKVDQHGSSEKYSAFTTHYQVLASDSNSDTVIDFLARPVNLDSPAAHSIG
jgi:hypothetical protein